MISIATFPITPTNNPLHHIDSQTVAAHQSEACWAGWWYTDRRRIPGGGAIMSYIPRFAINPGQEQTIRNYAEWMIRLGYDMRVTYYPNSTLRRNSFKIESTSVTAIELVYSYEDDASWTFVGFNLMRLLGDEFWYTNQHGAFPENMEPCDYMSHLFSAHITNSNHVPFVDMHVYWYGGETNNGYYYGARIGTRFGTDLYDWFNEVLPGHKNANHGKMGQSYARRESNLSWATFLHWLSKRDILNVSPRARKELGIVDSGSTEYREKDIPYANKVDAWDRPRDSRGRFKRREATAARSTPGATW
jgi:hypothetical protein